MNKDLIITRMEEHSAEWHAFRENGIGGSECANAIGLGHPKYSCPAKLYHEKVGTYPPEKFDNQRMFWGRRSESNIADVWKYYDNTEDGYVENFNNGKIVRECRNVNGYIVNPKYPWLFASVDRLMNITGGINFLTGEALKTEAILECKNVGQYASNAWEDGVPMYFLIQVMQYMIVLETDYAEIAMLVDGGVLKVEKIHRDDVLCEQIIRMTKSFWYDRVLPAKEAFKKRELADAKGNVGEAEKYDTIIQHLEPEPNDSEAYNEFMNEKFVKEREGIEGTLSLFKTAKRYKFLNELAKKIKHEQTFIKNIFAKFLTDNSAETVDFGTKGKVSWSTKKNAKNRVFNNRIKDKPEEDLVQEEFDKLNLTF